MEVQAAHRVRCSDRLEVFEGLAAGQAAVQRLAGGGTEGRQRSVCALPQRGQSTLPRAWMRIGCGPSCTARRRRRRDAVARSLRRPSALIQSVVQAGARRVRDRHRAEAGGRQRVVHALRDDLGGRAAAVGGRQHHLDGRRRLRPGCTSRTMPRSHTDSTGTSGSGTPSAPPRRRSRSHGRPSPSPARPGVLALQRLHLGQDEAHVLAVHALRAGADEGRVGGTASAWPRQHACISAASRIAALARAGPRPRPRPRRRPRRRRTSRRVGPDAVQRGAMRRAIRRCRRPAAPPSRRRAAGGSAPPSGLAGDGGQFGVATTAMRCQASFSQVASRKLRSTVSAKSPPGECALLRASAARPASG
jgi:hypothetical protein